MATKPASKSKTSTPVSKSPTAPDAAFIFGKENYIAMITGVIVILIGFALMSGGQTANKDVFPADEIYSFRRITLAPIVVMLGFAIEIFAILKRPKD